MSRIGKKPIAIPEGVEVKAEKGRVSVKGPKGQLERVFDDSIKIIIEDGFVKLAPVSEAEKSSALWGTYASHVQNMIEGVLNGFTKNLIIEGIGYKAATEGKNLVLSLGFSHPVKMPIPAGLEIKTEKNKITVSGADKEAVGQTAAKIRALKKPEPYKGKGIRYENEIVRRKAGKKAISSAG